MGSYRVVVAPAWFKGTRFGVGKRYAYEHHVKAEKFLGRPLRKREIVHHEDENKRNNRRRNLKVWTRSEHSKHHAPKPSKPVALECSWCNIKFKVTERMYKKKLKQGNVNFYCGRSCMGSFQGRANAGKSGRPKKSGSDADS